MRRSLCLLALAVVPTEASAQASDDKAEIQRLQRQVEDLTRRLEAIENGRLSMRASARREDPKPPDMSPQTATMAATSTTDAIDHVARLVAAEPESPARSGPPINVPIGPADHTLATPDRPARFQLNAGNASSQASFAFTRTVSRPNLGRTGRGTGVYTSLTFGAQAPLDKEADATDLATLDGLADSFAVKIGFSQIRVALADPDVAMAALEAKAVAACKADVRVSDKTDCDVDTNRQNILSTYLTKEEYAEYLSGGFPSRSAVAFGLTGRIGYRKFGYLDVPTAARSTAERMPWSVGGYATLLPGLSAASLTGGVEFQRSYKASATQTICPAAQGSASFVCATGPGGSPAGKSALLLSIEGRRLFATGSLLVPTIGLAPQLTYDALQDRLGLDVPVYLVSDEKSGLLGGVRFGWTSGDGGFVTGIFVGYAFSLFK